MTLLRVFGVICLQLPTACMFVVDNFHIISNFIEVKQSIILAQDTLTKVFSPSPSEMSLVSDSRQRLYSVFVNGLDT